MSENPNLLKTAALAKYFGERDQWGKEFGLKERETNASVALMGTRNEAAKHALETQRQEYLCKEQERKAYETFFDVARASREKFNLGVQDLIKEDPTLANHIVQDSLGNPDFQQTFERMKALVEQKDQEAKLSDEELKAIEASIPMYDSNTRGASLSDPFRRPTVTGICKMESVKGSYFFLPL